MHSGRVPVTVCRDIDIIGVHLPHLPLIHHRRIIDWRAQAAFKLAETAAVVRLQSIVVDDVGVPTRAILSVHDHMGPYIISDSFINSKRIKGSWIFICDVCSAWFELMRGLMADSEASIVIGNILIFVVTALSETLFVFITLIEEHGLIMTRTVHLFDV